MSDDSCVLGGASRPGIPTLRLRETGFILTEPSNWLRGLVLRRQKALSTVLEYAKILREWFDRLDKRAMLRLDEGFRMEFHLHGRTIVDDADLIEWRDAMETAGISPTRINKKISCVFQFLVWCQDSGCVAGLYAVGEMLAVSVEEHVTRSKNGRGSVRKRSPLLLPNRRQSYRHTPNQLEIEGLHAEAALAEHAVRNSLMLSVAEEAGLRRAEIIGMLVHDIPALEVIEALQASGELHHMWVRDTKRGKRRKVPMSPHLLRTLFEYIAIEREDLLARYAGRKEQPENVFLSDRGRRFHPNAVSNLFGQLFRKVEIKNASLHRLRAVFLTRTVARFLGKTDEHGIPIAEATILLKAAEYAGHSSVETLRPYLTALIKARIDGATGTDLVDLEDKKRLLQRDVKILEMRSRELRQK
ncbi:tyrosine-type recombinase/integrase [Bradyrhizobium tropiciagri]|uniref:tyrosine-type recombinase/integrase n=1 Tax=Bradyrhizobium tropiciagri TaxID=312253 RepID=UPI0012FEA3ED|nr:site-specific integrase [Bradyrhizobium tropiciagri]